MNFLLREEPKIVCCHHLFSHNKISDQISNILSHVILFDFPESWPDAFHILSTGLSTCATGSLMRITETLYQAVRQITTKPGTVGLYWSCSFLDVIPFDDLSAAYFIAKKEELCKVAPTLFIAITPHWLKSSKDMLTGLSALGQVSSFLILLLLILLFTFRFREASLMIDYLSMPVNSAIFL